MDERENIILNKTYKTKSPEKNISKYRNHYNYIVYV